MSGGSENVNLIGGVNKNYQDVVDDGHAQVESSYDQLIVPTRKQFGATPNTPIQLDNIPTSKVIIQNPLGNDPIYVGGLGTQAPYIDVAYPGDYRGTIVYEGMSVPFPVKNANRLQVVGTPLQSFNYRCYPNVNTIVETEDVTPPNPDTNGPVVTLVEPEDGAVNVPRDEHIHIICNESLLPSSVNTDTVLMTPLPSGGYEAYVYALDDSHIDLNHMPMLEEEETMHLLEQNTTYTITLVQGGIKDLSENAIENEFSFSFTTIATDITKPTVSSINPTAGATSIQRDTTIVITMSEALDPATVNSTNVTLSPAATNSTFLDGSDPTKIKIDPTGNLAGSQLYTVTLIAGGVKDLEGNAILAQFQSTFTTIASLPGADITPPTITGRSPAPSATGVPVNSNIVITFSEALQAASVTGTSFELFKASTKITAPVPTISGFSVTLNPTSNLEYSTVYTFFVRNTVKDVALNSIAAQDSFSFTTTAPLQITVKVPAVDATGVSINTTVSIDFDASLQTSTVTASTIQLFDTSTTPATAVTCSRSFAATNTRVILTPSLPLKNSTIYQVFVRRGVLDGNGDNVGPVDISWIFTTASPPLVQLYNLAGTGSWQSFGDADRQGRGGQVTSTNTSGSNALYHSIPRQVTTKIRRSGSTFGSGMDDALYCRIRDDNGALKATIGSYTDARTITTSTGGASITFSNSGQNYVMQNQDCIFVEYEDGDSSHHFEINQCSDEGDYTQEVALEYDGQVIHISSRDMGATVNGLRT